MNTAMAVGLVPLSNDEREAVRLYYDKGEDLRTISVLTGLSVKTIRAATDRVADVMIDRVRTVAEPINPPAAQPDRTPPRQRVVRPAALPLAHTAPAAVLPEPALPNVAPVAVAPAPPAPRRPLPGPKPTSSPTPKPEPVRAPEAVDDGPGSPAWNALATSPAVRRWAVADGWQVPPAGRPLPGAIVLAYRKTHPTGGTS